MINASDPRSEVDVDLPRRRERFQDQDHRPASLKQFLYIYRNASEVRNLRFSVRFKTKRECSARAPFFKLARLGGLHNFSGH